MHCAVGYSDWLGGDPLSVQDFIIGIIGVLGGGSISAYLTQRWTRTETVRKAKAEASEAESAAAEKASEVWRGTVTHLQERVTELAAEVRELRDATSAQGEENARLVKTLAERDALIKTLEQEIVTLTKTIAGLTERVKTLEQRLLE